MAKIEIEGLRKVYGPVEAVKQLDLVIEDGEFIVLVGPSGCGKTTTLRMLAGFEDPSAGTIRFNGRIVNELEPGARNLGMVFQSHALFPHKTVYQNIEFGLRMKKVTRDRRRDAIRAVADMVRIGHLLGKMPGQCSGGESQRVALARTLVTEPDTFLLDEPLSSLDAKLRRELRAECDRIHAELQKTFVYVTHDQEEAMTLADRIVVMRDGEIQQIGSPTDIYLRPNSLFVADFFGSPSMNLVRAKPKTSRARAVLSSNLFDVAVGAELAAKLTDEVVVGVRPEKVQLAASRGKGARIQLVEPLGRDTLVYLESGDERPFIAILPGMQIDRFRQGQNVSIRVDPADSFVFDISGPRIA
jgi:multiple sugar transport system ATP-binding protein